MSSAAHVALTVLETLDDEPRPMVVQVGSIAASERSRAFFSLTQLLFYTDRPRFLQFSITGDVISVVGSPDELRELGESCALEIDAVEWNVVQVSEGELVDSAAGGVVERIINPLAVSGTSVLYISTFGADYVLIPCERLADAIKLLSSDLRTGATPELQRRVERSSATDDEQEPGSSPRTRYPLSVLERARIFQIDRGSRQLQTGALLRLFFFPHECDPPHALRTLIETPDELSCVCGDVEWLDEAVTAAGGVFSGSGEPWVPMRIGAEEGTPLDEVGLVAMYANVLRDAGLTILYLGGTSDCVMVRESDLPQAVGAFESREFPVRIPECWAARLPARTEADADASGETDQSESGAAGG